MLPARSGVCSSVFGACDQVEFLIGQSREFRHHGIVCHRHWETAGAQYAAKHIAAATVIEHARLRLVKVPETGDVFGVRGRPRCAIVGIDRVVAAIIDVSLELIGAPIVECICEYEGAALAAAVIDRHAR